MNINASHTDVSKYGGFVCPNMDKQHHQFKKNKQKQTKKSSFQKSTSYKGETKMHVTADLLTNSQYKYKAS